jgi:hypothetical protein
MEQSLNWSWGGESIIYQPPGFVSRNVFAVYIFESKDNVILLQIIAEYPNQ